MTNRIDVRVCMGDHQRALAALHECHAIDVDLSPAAAGLELELQISTRFDEAAISATLERAGVFPLAIRSRVVADPDPIICVWAIVRERPGPRA